MSSDDPENLKFCLCGCGKKIPSFDKKGRVRFYANGHNRRKPKILPKYRGIAGDLDKDKLEEVVEILSSLLDRFIGAKTTVPQLVLIAQQEKYIKELSENNDEAFFKNLKLRTFINNRFPKYVHKDMLDLEDEQDLVKLVGIAARGTIVSEEII